MSTGSDGRSSAAGAWAPQGWDMGGWDTMGSQSQQPQQTAQQHQHHHHQPSSHQQQQQDQQQPSFSSAGHQQYHARPQLTDPSALPQLTVPSHATPAQAYYSSPQAADSTFRAQQPATHQNHSAMASQVHAYSVQQQRHLAASSGQPGLSSSSFPAGIGYPQIVHSSPLAQHAAHDSRTGGASASPAHYSPAPAFMPAPQQYARHPSWPANYPPTMVGMVQPGTVGAGGPPALQPTAIGHLPVGLPDTGPHGPPSYATGPTTSYHPGQPPPHGSQIAPNLLATGVPSTSRSGQSASPSTSGSSQNTTPNTLNTVPRPSNLPLHAPNGRILLACGFCKHRKLKCDGIRPQCQQCAKRGLECQYAERIRRRGPGKARLEREERARQKEAAQRMALEQQQAAQRLALDQQHQQQHHTLDQQQQHQQHQHQQQQQQHHQQQQQHASAHAPGQHQPGHVPGVGLPPAGDGTSPSKRTVDGTHDVLASSARDGSGPDENVSSAVDHSGLYGPVPPAQ